MAIVVGRQVRHIGKIDLKLVVDTFGVGPSSRKTTTRRSVHGVCILTGEIFDHIFARFARVPAQRFYTAETTRCSRVRIDEIHLS